MSNQQPTVFSCSLPAEKTPNPGAPSSTPARGHANTDPGAAYNLAGAGTAVTATFTLTPVSQGGPMTSTHIAQPGPAYAATRAEASTTAAHVPNAPVAPVPAPPRGLPTLYTHTAPIRATYAPSPLGTEHAPSPLGAAYAPSPLGAAYTPSPFGAAYARPPLGAADALSSGTSSNSVQTVYTPPMSHTGLAPRRSGVHLPTPAAPISPYPDRRPLAPINAGRATTPASSPTVPHSRYGSSNATVGTSP